MSKGGGSVARLKMRSNPTFANFAKGQESDTNICLHEQANLNCTNTQVLKIICICEVSNLGFQMGEIPD